LIQIVIPKDVSSIYSDAFAGCTRLARVYFLGNYPFSVAFPLQIFSIAQLYRLSFKTWPNLLVNQYPQGKLPIILDDFSKFSWIYFLKKKSQVHTCFRTFYHMVDKLFPQYKIQRLQTDSDSLFKDQKFMKWTLSKGMRQNFSAPYVHEQNGTIERYIQQVNNSVRSWINLSNLPANRWEDLAETAIYLINRINSKTIPEFTTPFELIYHQKPDLSNLVTIGAPAYCAIYSDEQYYKKFKFAPRVQPCIVYGYAEHYKNSYNVVTTRTKISPIERNLIRYHVKVNENSLPDYRIPDINDFPKAIY
jgi:transposase InsO family protein